MRKWRFKQSIPKPTRLAHAWTMTRQESAAFKVALTLRGWLCTSMTLRMGASLRAGYLECKFRQVQSECSFNLHPKHLACLTTCTGKARYQLPHHGWGLNLLFHNPEKRDSDHPDWDISLALWACIAIGVWLSLHRWCWLMVLLRRDPAAAFGFPFLQRSLITGLHLLSFLKWHECVF